MQGITKKKNGHLNRTQTFVLTIVAVAGFLFGTLFVLGHNNLFHEIEYAPDIVLDSILSPYGRGVALLPAALDTGDKKIVLAEIAYRRSLLPKLYDTVRDRVLIDHQLFINMDSFDTKCLINFRHRDAKDTGIVIWWDYYISASLKEGKPIPPIHLLQPVRHFSTPYPENMDFFMQYPGFILWVFLIIIQFSLFLVLTVCAWMIIKNFKDRFPETYGVHRINLLSNAFIVMAAVIIVLFVGASYVAFFRPNLVTNGLFYKKMWTVLVMVAGLTAVAGVSCFTGFLLISGTPVKCDSDEIATDQDVDILNEMNSLFSNLLLIASIVLCTIVLTTGALYASVNGMDFIAKVTADMSYSPFAYHYVLLIAALCTLLLLLFFVPAKLRLIAIEKRIRKIDPNDNRIDKPTDIYGILKGLLVVGLPIITGLIHWIITAFTN